MHSYKTGFVLSIFQNFSVESCSYGCCRAYKLHIFDTLTGLKLSIRSPISAFLRSVCPRSAIYYLQVCPYHGCQRAGSARSLEIYT
jgi:hypothetical protein